MRNNTLIPDFMLLGAVSTILLIVLVFPLLLFLVVLDVGGSDDAAASEASVQQPSDDFGTRVAIARDEIENPDPVDFVVEIPEVAADGGDAMMINLDDYDEDLVHRGEASYLAVCASCHGTDGRGVSGLGKGLIESEFVRSMSDDELVDFVIVGRTIWDETNTTGVAMPARGGNPGLTDEDIYAIIAYVRVEDGYTGSVGTAGTEMVAADTTDTSETSETEDTGSSEPREPVVFEPIDTSGLSADSEANEGTANTFEGEALFNTLCETEDTAGTMCAFLQTIEDANRLRDLLTNGSSPFDSSIPSDVYVPARGGTLLFTDAQIDAVMDYLLGSGDVAETPAEDTSEAASEDASATEETTVREMITDRDGRDGATVFEALCGEGGTANEAGCDYLQSLVTEDIANYNTMLELVLNGPSPFDNSLPDGILLPARGGQLLLSDNEARNLVDHLFIEAGYGTSVDTTAVDNNGAVLYLELCTVDASTQIMCDFLIGLIRDGAERERLVDLLTNGSSPFDSSIPTDIFIPQRGGTLLFTDEDIQDLVDYLYALAGDTPVETSQLPYHTQERTTANVSYIGRLQGSVVFPHRNLPDFTMESTTGEDFTLSDYRGKTVIVYFGYLTCPDVCPMTMVDIRRAYQQVGEPSDDVVVVFITIDPERDSMDLMKRYVEGFNADFIGLRPTDNEQLEYLMQQFGVIKQVREVDSALEYLVDHSATVFMVGPDGRLVSQFPFGVSYTEIANDMTVLSDYMISVNDLEVTAEFIDQIDPAREYRIVIPPGTGELIRRGEDPGIIPLQIDLTLGERDILVLENNDDADYLVGGIWVAPHETVAKQFYEEQTFVGLCTVTVGRDLIEIVVSAPED